MKGVPLYLVAALLTGAWMSGVTQAQSGGGIGALEMGANDFLTAIDGSCFDFAIIGACPSLWCPDCVLVKYWIPTLAVEVFKKPGDTVIDIPMLNEMAQAALSATGIPAIGGGGGDNAGQSGKGSLHYYETRVWHMPPVFTQACSLCGDNGDTFRLAYTSEIDPHWRTGEFTTFGVQTVTGIPVLSPWGPLTPLVGHVVHGSPHVAAAVDAVRGMLIPSTPQVPPRPVFSQTTPTACMQPAWPKKMSCMPVGAPPMLWDYGILAFRGTYVFLFWQRRSCCISSSSAACGLGTRAAAEATLGTAGGADDCGLGLGLPAPVPPVLPPVSRACTFIPGGDITGETYVVSSTEELSAALRQAKPGDGILLKAGSYAVASRTLRGLGSGTSDKPIIIRPAPGAEGQVDWHPAKRYDSGLIFDGVSHVIIEGLKFHGYGSTVSIENSSYVVFRGNEISDGYRACLGVKENASHILIEGNRIHDCGVGSNGRTKAQSGINGEGIYIGLGRAHLAHLNRTITHVTIRYNEIYATTDEGINIKNDAYTLVENNYVHDIVTSDPGAINFNPGGARSVKGTNMIARGNVVQNIRGHRDKPGAGIGINGAGGAQVSGNTICQTTTPIKNASVSGNRIHSAASACDGPARQLQAAMRDLPSGGGRWQCGGVPQTVASGTAPP